MMTRTRTTSERSLTSVSKSQTNPYKFVFDQIRSNTTKTMNRLWEAIVFGILAILGLTHAGIVHADPGDVLELAEATRTLPANLQEGQFRHSMEDLYTIMKNYHPKNMDAEQIEVSHVNHASGNVKFSFLATKTVLGVSMRARFVAYVSSEPTQCSETIDGLPAHPNGWLVRLNLAESDSLVNRNVSDLYGEVCLSETVSGTPLKIRLRTHRLEGSSYQLINGGVLDKLLKEQIKPLSEAVTLAAEQKP